MRFPTRVGMVLLPENKPAAARVLNGELIIVWDGGIAKRAASPTENLAALTSPFTRANLTSAVPPFVIKERP